MSKKENNTEYAIALTTDTSPVQENGKPIKKHWWQQNKADNSCNAATLKSGDACPSCIVGTLDYDSLFLLTCDICGKVAEGGFFT